MKQHQLEDLDIWEVSLVGSPANREPFLVIKNEAGESKAEVTEPQKPDLDGVIKSLTGASAEQRDELIKTLFPEHVAKMAAMETQVAEMTRARKLADYTEIAKSFYGAPAENAERLMRLEESLGAEAVAKEIEREKAIAEQVRKSKLFSEAGVTSGQRSAGNAEAELTKIAKSKGGDFADAFKVARRENPELAEQWEAERAEHDLVGARR